MPKTMSIAKVILASACFACTIVPSTAADDPIETRQLLMKNVGSATGTLGKMLKGELDYDPIAAEQAMRSLAGASAGFVHFFPDGSQTGGDTEALPAIWENRDDFNAISAKMTAAAFAGIDGVKSGPDGLKAAFGPVVQNCKACHQDFRQAK